MSRRARRRVLDPLATGICYALICLLSFLQQPGLVTNDTRMELTESPGSFLAGAFSLWRPGTTLGEIQNQAYGYLFPQGPWFLLTEGLGVPPWVSQRLWTALVLLVAVVGARRVAARFGLTGGASLVVGLAYGLSPRLVGTAGVISAETLPAAVLPWVLLPVLAAVDGSLSSRRAAVLSAAGVVAMGGVNAVVVIGALPLVLVFVVWAVVTRRTGWSLLGWWSGAVVVATAWWLVPLFFLGVYSPPFYQYVESAEATTSVVGFFQAFTGTSHWIGFLEVNDVPWWSSATAFVSVPWLVALTALLAALGALGLCLMRHPYRVPLAIGAAVALTALTIAHGGWYGSPLGEVFQNLLDGPLAAFRNVNKVEPTLRLPLALGLGSLVDQLVRSSEWPRRVPRSAAPVLVGALCLAMLQPFFVGDGRIRGWDEIPSAWRDAARYLRAHQGEASSTWVVPGSGFAVQDWGRTLQEPLTASPEVRWVSRTQVPLVPGQSIRMLDGLESVLEAGTSSPHLADVLARMRVSHVLLRRDLDRSQSDAPDPSYAERTLSTSPGFARAQDFGPLTVWDVLPAVPRARLAPTSSVETVQGGPEDIPRLVAGGILGDRLAVLAGEDGWTNAATLLTDGYQDRDRNFGRVFDAVGPILSADDPNAVDRAVTDYPGPPGGRRVQAEYSGAASITASSSRGFVDVFGPVVPQYGPYSAFDGLSLTRWESAPFQAPTGQWVEMRLSKPRVLDKVVVTTSHDFSVLPVTSVRVTAGGVTRTADVVRVTGRARVDLGGVRASRVRVTVATVSDSSSLVSVGIDDVALDGITISRSLRVPAETTGDDPAISLSTGREQRACRSFDVPSTCAAERVRGAEESSGLDRELTLPRGGQFRISGEVVARPSSSAARLLDPLGTSQVVRGSSTLGQDPAVAVRSAYDGDAGTAWVTQLGDSEPAVSVRWDGPRTIRGLRLDAELADGSRPGLVRVESKQGNRVVALRDGVMPIRPLRTTAVRIVFPQVSGQTSLRVHEMELVGVADFVRPVDPTSTTGSVCGLGPPLVVNGVVVPTRVLGRMQALRAGDPLQLYSCAGPVTLSPGKNHLVAGPTDQFQTVRLVLRPVDSAPATSPEVAQPDVTRWSSSRRSVVLPSSGSAQERVLSMSENANRGWVASVGDRSLVPLVVDGWQQGWRVPAGVSGEISIRFAPETAYRVVLVVGLALAGLLLICACALLVLGARSRGAVRRKGRSQATYDARGRGRVRGWRLTVVAAVVTAVLGGVVMALAVAGAARLGQRAAAAGAGLLMGAGVVTAWGSAAVWSTAGQVLSALGIGLLGAALLHASPVGPPAEGPQ